jgi:hypothetical protein
MPDGSANRRYERARSGVVFGTAVQQIECSASTLTAYGPGKARFRCRAWGLDPVISRTVTSVANG